MSRHIAPRLSATSRSARLFEASQISRIFGRTSVVAFVMAAVWLDAGASVKAANKSWLGGAGNFATPGAWAPFGAPGVGDAAFVGNIESVENSQINVEAPMTMSSLQITDGMTVYTNDAPLTVLGATTVEGQNIVPPDFGTYYSTVGVANSPAGVDFTTGSFHASAEGRLELLGNAAAVVHGVLNLSDDTATLRGNGSVTFTGAGTTLINNGVIFAGGLDGMTLNQTGGGLYDLDGTTGGGRLLVSSNSGGLLTVSGTALTDAYSSTISIGAGDRLHMNLSDGWVADASSTIGSAGDGGVSPPARITGADFVVGGEVLVTSYDAHLQVEPATTIAATAVATVGENCRLEFTGPTTVQGGAFTTFSKLSADGSVDFVGQTKWDGDVTIAGVARQVGSASVTGPTSIVADVFDMDGNGATAWSVVHSAVVTAESIDSTISNTMDGEINVASGFLSALRINLTGAFDEWTMAGQLNLSGDPNFFITRIAGSRMRLTGELNLAGVNSQIGADVVFANAGMVNFAAANTVLRTTAETRIASDATFVGDGALRNGSTGSLLLEDGATLDQVGLINDGLLRVGDSAGVASVDRLAMTGSSDWLVEIGGFVTGAEHDLLIVGGGAAEIAGQIEVDLIDAGNGLFQPAVGDIFRVLTALDGVSGAFDNNPISQAGGNQYHWSVIYNSHDVRLELVDITSIVPEPPSAAVICIGCALAAGVRRRTTTTRR